MSADLSFRENIFAPTWRAHVEAQRAAGKPMDLPREPLIRAHYIATGVVVPDPMGPDGLEDPGWLRRRLAEMPCLTLEGGT